MQTEINNESISNKQAHSRAYVVKQSLQVSGGGRSKCRLVSRGHTAIPNLMGLHRVRTSVLLPDGLVWTKGGVLGRGTS